MAKARSISSEESAPRAQTASPGRRPKKSEFASEAAEAAASLLNGRCESLASESVDGFDRALQRLLNLIHENDLLQRAAEELLAFNPGPVAAEVAATMGGRSHVSFGPGLHEPAHCLRVLRELRELNGRQGNSVAALELVWGNARVRRGEPRFPPPHRLPLALELARDPR